MRTLARELDLTVAQQAIAWVAAKGRISYRWSARAAAGERYSPSQMDHLDSETG